MNYDGFIDDVSVGDILLVDGGLQSLIITDKSGKDVHTEVVDGGTMTSRYAWASSLPSQVVLHGKMTGAEVIQMRARLELCSRYIGYWEG